MEGIADAHLDAFLKQLGGEILPSGGDEDEESDASEELAPAKPGGGVLTKPGRGRLKGHAGHVYSEIVLHLRCEPRGGQKVEPSAGFCDEGERQ